jgi:hypothetical protein
MQGGACGEQQRRRLVLSRPWGDKSVGFPRLFVGDRYKVPIYTIQLLLQTRKHLLLQEQRIEQCFLNKSGFGFLKEENIKILVQMQDN